jgi:ATP-dependent helicase/nuclease subunit B
MPLIISNSEIDPMVSFDSQLRDILQSGKPEEFILIAPTNRKIRQLKREFLDFVPNNISTSFNVFTLELLFKKIYSIVSTQKYLIDGELQSVFFEESIMSIAKHNGLKFFRLRPDGKMPRGTFEKVSRMISEFKENFIFPEDLESDRGSIAEYEIEKVNDIINIYREYNNLLGDKFIDTGSIYQEVNNKFTVPFHNDIFKSAFRNVKDVFIYGFSEFSRPEIRFINTLFDLENVNVSIWYDYNQQNHHLFGHLSDSIDSFKNNIKIKSILENETENKFSDFIAGNLFKYNNTVKKQDFSEKINLFAAKDRLEEVEFICKQIRNIIKTNPDIDLTRICIATYSTEKYTNLFRELFDRFQIPVNITDRFKLSSSALISSFIAFLEIPHNNFRRKDIFRALLSPYLKFIKPDGKEIDTFNLFNISNFLKIKFGEDLWINKIERRLAFLNGLLNGGETQDEIKIKNEIRKLELAKEDILFLKSFFTVFSSKLLPREFENEILKLIKKLGISFNILNIHSNIFEKELIEKDTRALSKFLDLLSEMKTIYDFRGLNNVKNSFSSYLENLRIIISGSLYNIKQQYGKGIFVTAAEETRGLDFDIMFLAGLIEGDFPISFKPEIFKPEIRRKTEEQNLMENRYLFYQIITNFSKSLFLSYPKYQNDVELIPSTFLKSLKEIIICNENPDELLVNKIYSRIDLQRFLGKSFKNSGDILSPFDEFQSEYNSILKGIKIEKSREKEHSVVEYEGIIPNQLSEIEIGNLQNYKNKEYSISELEDYGKCPMKYFLGRILNLEVFEEEDDDITAMELGSILHEALFEFYHDNKVNKHELNFPLNDIDLTIAIQKLKDIAINKIEELNITNPFFQLDFEKIIGDGLKRKGILQSFLEYENGEEKSDKLAGRIFKPKYFEVSFGKHTGSKKHSDADLSSSSCIELDGINMRGKIDRIDILEENDHFYFMIYDYKTGKSPDLNEIFDGTSLQLPIYILALEKLFLETLKNPYEATGGIYYLLQTQIDLKPGIVIKDFMQSKSHSLKDEKTFREILNISKEFLKKYVGEITGGKFGLPLKDRNLEKICKYCDYKTVCRVQSVKVLDFDE